MQQDIRVQQMRELGAASDEATHGEGMEWSVVEVAGCDAVRKEEDMPGMHLFAAEITHNDVSRRNAS